MGTTSCGPEKLWKCGNAERLKDVADGSVMDYVCTTVSMYLLTDTQKRHTGIAAGCPREEQIFV